MKSYKDALFQLHTRPFIIGLTGYTGSGCTTASKIITSNSKPKLPNYNVVESDDPSSLEELIYQKLEREWNDIDWVSFKNIEIARVIFLFAINKALKSRLKDDSLEVIRSMIDDDSKKELIKGLNELLTDKEVTSKNGKAIIKSYEIASKLYPKFKGEIKRKKELDLGNFIKLMQDYGDHIRKYGEIVSKRKPHPKYIYTLPKSVSRLIAAYYYTDTNKRFVIDAFRNPFEVEYFKKRYNDFYLVAINRNSDDIDKELKETMSKNLVEKIKERERGNLYKTKNSSNIHEWVTSQDITSCLQKAEIFIDNLTGTIGDYYNLKFGLIKLITLRENPGCIPPTLDERCMQTAFVSAQMSGCISRKVGAVVLDKNHYVVGVGWNNTPSDQVPCALRTRNHLINSATPEVFSEYERTIEFKEHMDKKGALDKPFCFKDEYSELKNSDFKHAEFTRSLHAEENALFQATSHTGNILEGATLYTTSSTCNLCAKKSYQLKIKRIVYIDEYPGIAVEQTLNVGNYKIINNRFFGIIGASYFKLFDSLLPEKDLYNLYLPNVYE